MNREGICITVFSPKGGVGKTAMCINIAELASAEAKNSIIVELDTSPGCLVSTLGVNRKINIVDVADKKFDKDFILNQAVKYVAEKGFSILPGALPRDYSEHSIEEEDIRNLILVLKRSYDVIIIDTQPNINQTISWAMKYSEEVIIPISPETGPFSRIKSVVLDYEKFWLTKEILKKFNIVINRISYDTTFPYKAIVEKTLERPIIMEIPELDDFKNFSLYIKHILYNLFPLEFSQPEKDVEKPKTIVTDSIEQENMEKIRKSLEEGNSEQSILLQTDNRYKAKRKKGSGSLFKSVLNFFLKG